MVLDLEFLRTNIPVQKYPILKFVRLSEKSPLKVELMSRSWREKFEFFFLKIWQRVLDTCRRMLAKGFLNLTTPSLIIRLDKGCPPVLLL